MPTILDLDPATYQRHAIHTGERIWAETNCYADVIIELLNGLGHEPIACLPFTFTIDFDVDQWTFFKFRHADIEALYALGIHEMAPWRSLAEHLHEQVVAGRPVLVELDSFYLPDTAGTSYRSAHVKSTVAVNAIDLEARTLGYFHNQSYHALSGADFVDVLQFEGLAHERMLPPYIEFVKPVPRASALVGPALVEGSLTLLRHHLQRVPTANPFHAFHSSFQRDAAWLLASAMDVFHAYSFATLRQYGACFELSSTYLHWLDQQGVDGVLAPAETFADISRNTKTLQFQLARAMARRRPLDLAALDGMARSWDEGMEALNRQFL